MPAADTELAEVQLQHWDATYRAKPHMYGWAPSEPARYAAAAFHAAGVRTVLELGAGHGRDSLFFGRCGFAVHATDFSSTGLNQLRQRARLGRLADQITATVHDVRTTLPLADGSVDAVYAHMLLSMALATHEIAAVVAEVSRVLRPGGLFVYTVRHIGDAHFRAGVARGDGIFEHGGFAVHFFDRALVDAVADGWRLHEVAELEEGKLPRRLWRVLQTKPASG
jgi:SAM-dependent methyltransferase